MIVVTGGAGFIGSVLVWKLNELGYSDILVVDHKAEASPKWDNLKNKKFADYMEADDFLELIKSDSFKEKTEALFHMGACTDTTEMDLEYLDNNNFQYTKILAEWALKNDVRYIYASSAATYGAGELGYTDQDSITPKLKPLNPYGDSKQKFDLWVLANNLQDKIAGFKFFNVFGPNEYHKGHMSSVVYKGYNQIKKEGKIRLFKSYHPDYADGGQLRDFVYTKDVAQVLIWFFRNPEKNGIFNLGTAKARNWNDLAGGIFKALGLENNIEYIEMPDNLKNQYQYYTEANLDKLISAGYQEPFSSLEDSIADYVKEYLEKPNQYL